MQSIVSLVFYSSFVVFYSGYVATGSDVFPVLVEALSLLGLLLFPVIILGAQFLNNARAKLFVSMISSSFVMLMMSNRENLVKKISLITIIIGIPAITLGALSGSILVVALAISLAGIFQKIVVAWAVEK